MEKEKKKKFVNPTVNLIMDVEVYILNASADATGHDGEDGDGEGGNHDIFE